MKMRVLLVILLLITGIAFADTITAQPQTSETTHHNISYEDCTKMFSGINKEKLFYLTLGAISANRFSVEEIQSYNGYIIFSAAKRNYLATIAGIDNNNSILKITPCNNVYYFQPGIINNIFRYIELNKNAEIK